VLVVENKNIVGNICPDADMFCNLPLPVER